MQETRHHILEILRGRGQATVDEIVADLQERRGKITAVTVRHHLARLQEDGLIIATQLRRRDTPGRPQYIYQITRKAREHFPTNYQQLTTRLLEQMGQQLPAEGVNVILEGVADAMALEASIPDGPLPARLDSVVDYLDQKGYAAYWEKCDGGYVLHTTNCPYHHVAETTQHLCEMDMRLVSALLGVVPRLLARVSSGGSTCAYLIPDP